MATYDPYAPPATELPPPPGAAGGDLLPPPRRRLRGPVVALLVVGVVVLLAAVTAGALAVRRIVVGAPDRLVSSVPADAVAYGHVNLRPSAGNLLGLVSLADRLEEATGEPLLDRDRLVDELAEDDDAVWAEDIEPWLGDQAAFFALEPEQGAEPDTAAFLVLVDDRSAAEAFVTGFLDPAGAWDAGEDAVGWDLGDDLGVVAVTDDLFIAGEPGAVTAALQQDGPGIAEEAAYADLVAELPASVATLWVDVEAVSRVLDEQAGALPGLDTPATAAQVAVGLSLTSGAADITAVSRPTEDAAAVQTGTAPAALADLPGEGLAYLRVPDLGANLATALDAADEAAAADPGAPLPSAQVDEGLAAYGTDLATVSGWLGDVVAVVGYDPTLATDNSGLLVRAAVSDEDAATALVDAALADVPADSGLEVAPGSVTSGSASLAVADGAVSLRAGTLSGSTLGDDAAFTAALDGLDGEPVAYLDVRAVVGAVAPFLVAGQELDPEQRQTLDALAAFDRLVVTTQRTDAGLDRSSIRLSWGQPLQPLDLDAEQNPPDVDLGVLGGPGGLAGLGAGGEGDLGADLGGDLGTDLGTDVGDVDTYGDDPALDALWDACAGGDDAACEELFYSSPVDSGYEAFALTCGGRATEETFGCVG
jgi:hypothetical protein